MKSHCSMALLAFSVILVLVRVVCLFQIDQISGPVANGEGPHWDADRKLIFFVSIPSAKVYRFDPAKNITTHAEVDASYTSFIVPVRDTDDQFVVGLGKYVGVITWDGISSHVAKGQIRKLFSASPECWRFNDAKCDDKGRLFAGTMGHKQKTGTYEPSGALYELKKAAHQAQRLLTGVRVSNGLAWSYDQKICYYVDSDTYTVDAFDYEVLTGDIGNRRVIFDLKKNNLTGIADGMTIDTNGNLWIAINGGGMVAHVDPRTGTLLRKLRLPTRDVTSVVFAGDNLDQLIVTSGYNQLTKSERMLDPLGGATFRVSGLGVTGYPSVSAVL